MSDDKSDTKVEETKGHGVARCYRYNIIVYPFFVAKCGICRVIMEMEDLPNKKIKLYSLPYFQIEKIDE